jgi:zinc transport system ATP-binding protein
MIEQEIVKLENISASYNALPVLTGINLTIFRNDFLGIIGPNGGGKTTLLKIILGLVRPDSGSVRILGSSAEKNRRSIGYVPQYTGFDQAFPINVHDVVLMGRYSKRGILHYFNKADRQSVDDALEKVAMNTYRNKQIGQLSGGQQQRVFIARALVTEPELLLLDEPTAGIDAAMQTEFYEILEELKKEMAIVMVSHDISAVSVYVNKIACLNQQLFYHGSKEISQEILEATYKCPVHMIAHGDIPHTVLKGH